MAMGFAGVLLSLAGLCGTTLALYWFWEGRKIPAILYGLLGIGLLYLAFMSIGAAIYREM